MDATDLRVSLDEYATENGIEKVHLMKIDTDGHELEVLSGARQLITNCRPRIVMELCPHLLEERQLTLKNYTDTIGPCYRLKTLRTGRPFDEAAFARIPWGGGVDVLAEAS